MDKVDAYMVTGWSYASRAYNEGRWASAELMLRALLRYVRHADPSGCTRVQWLPANYEIPSAGPEDDDSSDDDDSSESDDGSGASDDDE